MRSRVPSPQDKPVLDEREFQLLLAAAYKLQAQKDRPPTKVAKGDHAQTFSDRASAEAREPIKLPEKDVLEPAQSGAVHFTRPLHPQRSAGTRSLLNEELFWKVAIVVTVVAVSALLLGALMHRFSLLPVGVSLPSKVIQRPTSFQATKRIVGSPAPNSSVKPNRGVNRSISGEDGRNKYCRSGGNRPAIYKSCKSCLQQEEDGENTSFPCCSFPRRNNC